MNAARSSNLNTRAALVTELLNAGADFDAKSNEGYTALKYAGMNKAPDIIDLLKNAGAHD